MNLLTQAQEVARDPKNALKGSKLQRIRFLLLIMRTGTTNTHDILSTRNNNSFIEIDTVDVYKKKNNNNTKNKK